MWIRTLRDERRERSDWAYGRAAARLVALDKRRTESSTFQAWLDEYAVDAFQRKDEGSVQVRIETIPGDLKSAAHPSMEQALRDGYSAWFVMATTLPRSMRCSSSGRIVDNPRPRKPASSSVRRRDSVLATLGSDGSV